MRALSRTLAALTVLALAAACSKHDDSGTSQSDIARSAKDAAGSAQAELKKIAHDRDVKRAEADLKTMGHDAARDLRKSVAEAKGATGAVVNDAQHAAQRQDQAEKSRSDNSSS